MKIWKKVLCSLLVVVLCLTSAPLSGFVGLELPKIDSISWFGSNVSAIDEYTEGYYTYTVSNGEATITDVDSAIEGEISIPSTLDGYPVTTIGAYAFYECGSLTSITIPDSVTTIGDYALAYCDSLTSITIGDSVTTIGYKAFDDCYSLTSIVVDADNPAYSSDSRGALFDKNKTILIQYPIGNTNSSYSIPNSVTTIGNMAFHDCDSLTSITIPNSVTTIGYHAFLNCDSLTSITIGDSVTTIGDRAFYCCDSLTSIVVDADNPAYSSDSRGALFDKNKTILIQYPVGNTNSSYSIPNSVTTIGDDAFYSCDSLTSITIPDSVTTIGDDAFYECGSLTSVTIGDSVTTIGDRAFAYCRSLTSVTIPNSVTTIGDRAFASCDSLTSVTIGDSVTTIGDYAFDYCRSLTSITIPDSVTTIGDDAFYLCDSLTSITIPDSVTTIGDSAFYWCDSLASVTIGDSVTTIGDRAFDSCDSLTSVTIGDSVTTIGEDAFAGCGSLTSITIPDSVTTIGDCAFLGCVSLTSLTIPDSVTTIGDRAFASCDSLTSIVVDADNPAYSSDSRGALFDKNKTILIQYPIGNTNSSYTIPDSVTTIVEIAFHDCGSLISITIPDSVTTIGDSAFAYCRSLTSITIPDSVTTIGDYAFYRCDSLTSVTIPDSVTTIGEWAFYSCGSLTDVYFIGSEEDWNKITIEDGNDYLLNATLHFDVPCPHANITIYNAIAPNCTEVGYTDGKYCNDCDTWLIERVEIPKIDHDFKIIDSGKVPICEEDGYTAKRKCSVCGKEDGGEVIPSGDHDFKIIDSGKVPTCEEDGYTAKRKCSICGKEYGGEVIPSDGHIDNNDDKICDVCKENLGEPECTHKETFEQTIPASCTVSGMKFTVCVECGETIGNPEVIPAAHTPGEWETVIEPTYEAEGKKVKKCTVCGETLEEEIIPKLELAVVEDEETGVGLEFPAENYDGKVEIEVEESFDGTAFNILDTKTGAVQQKIYDIKMLVDGEVTQPNGKVKVKLPLPAGYNPKFSFVYYVNTETKEVEKMEATYEDGYMVFETDHFSYYAVVAEPDTDNCSCNCHAGGIKGFFFKFLLFFQKIFKTNKVCKCGINHY